MTEPRQYPAKSAGAGVDRDVFARSPRRRTRPRLRGRLLAAVFVGGVAGGLARYAITTRWPEPPRGVPWATLTVNTSGAFALALLLVLVIEAWRPTTYIRPMLGTGFLGAFTTFSAVVTTTDRLAASGAGGTAALYLGLSTVAGLAAASLGLVMGRGMATYRGSRRPQQVRAGRLADPPTKQGEDSWP